jgi:hypothetical protein
MSDQPKFGSNSRNDAWENPKSKRIKGSSQNPDSGPDSVTKECPEIPGSRATGHMKQKKETDFKDRENESKHL